MVFILGNRDRVFSRELVAALERRGVRPWLELRRGKQIAETWLAQRLRAYGIKSRTLRIGAEVSRGYLQEDIIETCRRYIPKSEMEALKADLAERTVTESETSRTDADQQHLLTAENSENTKSISKEFP